MKPVIAGWPHSKALACAVLTAPLLSASPAMAACLQSGNTVDCSGTINSGFGTGAENDLTATIQPGASMSLGAGVIGFNLANGNTVTNKGSMIVGANGMGFQGFDNNAFTNTGSISLGTSAVAAFSLGNNNTFSNTGTITSSAFNAIGFDALGSGHTLSNSGTINLTGTGSYGVTASGSNTTVLNSGTISVGQGSAGTNGAAVWLQTSSSFSNSGTVNGAGDNGTGLSLGIGNIVTNSGLITATGDQGIAVGISDIGNTIVNNGSIRAGTNGYTLFSFGTNGNTITNNGTMDGWIFLIGSNNTLINSGLITVTDPATFMNGSYSIGGVFTQTASGTLGIRVNNAGAHDTLYADQANLNGTLRALVQRGLYGAPVTYTNVVDSTSPIAGQFSNVTSSSAFFNAIATYHANSVDLTLTRLGFGSVAGETANQRAVGNALEAGYSPSLTGTAASFYTRLLQAASVGALDRLSGEGTSATQNTAFGMAGLFGQTVDSQMAAWRTGAAVAANTALGYAPERPNAAESAFAMLKAPAMTQPQWNVWASGFGATQSLAGRADPGSADFSSRTGGGAIGLGYTANPDLLLGIAAGASTATFSVADRATSGRLDAAHVTGYAMQKFGAGYVSAQLGYSHFDNDTTRIIAGIGPDETVKDSFGSQLVGGRLEVGRSFDFGRVMVTPFAAVQASRLWQAGYSETSTAGAAPGILGLSYAARSVSSFPVFLGSQFDGQFQFGNGMIWAPFLRAAWVHEFEPSRAVTASLISVPAPAWTVEGARAAADAGRLEIGSRLLINRWTELSARFTGEFSGSGQSYAGTGAVKVSW